MTLLEDAIDGLAKLGPLDGTAMAAARRHFDGLTKPPGSLGRLEDLAVQLAGITGEPAPTFARRTVVVAAADHGIAAHGVSAYSSSVTGQMVANFVAGGAAISVLAALVGADVLVVDAGIAEPLPVATPLPTASDQVRLLSAPIRRGTADMSTGPAMTRAEAEAAIDLGLGISRDLVTTGTGIVAVGEMGIGNTTAASAIVAVMAGAAVADVTGTGTGLDDAGRARKVELIERSLGLNRPDPADPVGVLAAVGGLEIAVLVGVMLAAAVARVPVVLDGFITGAAGLVAAALCPSLRPRLIASHRSPEPGHAIILERLGARPLLDLDLRLGEATGAAFALGLIDAACALRDGMATFASAGVSDPTRG